MMPGGTLHRIAKALCSVDIRERVIDALIADCQHEWLSAADSTGRVSAVARCWASFWIALAGCLAHDVRHDVRGFARRLAPVVWISFWAVWWRDDLARNIPMMTAYTPALIIWFYRNKTSERRSWAGFASALLSMAALFAARDLLPEYRHMLGWAAGSCLAASWTFLIKKQPSVVKPSH